MSTTTPNLGLFKYDPNTDGAQTFNITKALNENWDKVDESVLLALAAAGPYSTSQTYAFGAYCTREGNLYRCTTAITTAEAWTADHWTETTVGAELVAIYTLLSNKAPKSEFDAVKAKVMDTSASNVDVFLTGDELPGYINSLPRLVNNTIRIYVSGTITQNLNFQGFYGSGGLWIRRNGSTNVQAKNITVSFSDCSCRIYFHNFDFTDSGASSNTDYKAVVTILNCRAIWIENCTFTGNGSNKAIFSENHSLVQVSSCTITNFDIALAPFGFSIMSVNTGVSGSNNSKGFHIYGPAIAVLYSSVNKLLGGASNYKDGGVIIQGNAFV